MFSLSLTSLGIHSFFHHAYLLYNIIIIYNVVRIAGFNFAHKLQTYLVNAVCEMAGWESEVQQPNNNLSEGEQIWEKFAIPFTAIHFSTFFLFKSYKKLQFLSFHKCKK